jgi:hypothetical protein
MPEPETQMTVVLLSTCVGLLVLMFSLMFWIARRLSRIERLIARDHGPLEVVEHATSSAESSTGGAFEVFLSEDLERRALTKGEQFAAYRQWRQKKGMNWSSSAE